MLFKFIFIKNGRVQVKQFINIRSEVMVLKKIRIPKENAIEIMNELGKVENGLEFIDLTKNDMEAKKNFHSMINRCDEVERKIK
jgi:hypothetical protein